MRSRAGGCAVRAVGGGGIDAGVLSSRLFVFGDVLASPGDVLANVAGATDLVGRLGLVRLLGGASPEGMTTTPTPSVQPGYFQLGCGVVVGIRL